MMRGYKGSCESTYFAGSLMMVVGLCFVFSVMVGRSGHFNAEIVVQAASLGLLFAETLDDGDDEGDIHVTGGMQ
jgi:hypothetical protein